MTHQSPAPLHLVPGEPFADGVRRIAKLELDRLLATIDSDAVDDAATVHEVRRTAKRLRALVRLVRDGAGSTYRDTNGVLRALGRGLAADRDADVALSVHDDLAADGGTGAEWDAIRTGLGERDEPGARDERLAEAREQLALLRWQVDGWDLPDGDGIDVLLAGHARVHDRARRAAKAARKRPTTEGWHEWRKRVKDDRHQSEVLRAAWPVAMDLRASLLHDLGDLLGADHDLAVLRSRVGLELADDHDYLAAIDARRATLQHEALALGTRVYALPTEAHVSRLRRWWKRATAEARATHDDLGSVIPPGA